MRENRTYRLSGGRRPALRRASSDPTQTAALLVLEAIFEADLQPEQYAYRLGRSALDAVRNVHLLLSTGHTEVIDADLTGYFETASWYSFQQSTWPISPRWSC